ncbi:glycosyltransferase [Knoellia aerolata]|uniref:D-inositol 3-phosphate glycosyltransferase n=1 Tax=Knoellia aerolata DSM 18566 TaxID=1385519 RepID=A0A0A0JZM0_9MICO|nr:glycosyltransferase [Knoellia aerolata]KGN42623.1 sucrose synthase (sucrose-UDP glucosyltransferase) [Knoellia aerolata DSM 18566]
MNHTLATPTMGMLDAVRTAPSLLAAIDFIDPLVASVRDDGDAATATLRDAIDDDTDQLTAIAAVHAAAAGGVDLAGALVVPLLTSRMPFLREHAAWALRLSTPMAAAVAPLRAAMEDGGFVGMLAEATLETWGLPEPEADDVVSPPRARRTDSGRDGLTVAQLFLHADIDGSLRNAGKGDTGGIATLLVHLGDALVAEPGVSRVLTLSRSHHQGERSPDDAGAPGHHYLGVPLPGPALPSADTWPLRLGIRRGLRRALVAAAPVDVLHLRMADVGSWAASEVAHELGIPTVLTLAPDPHALIAAREASGALTRATFGAADQTEHLVFRVRLLRDLADQAAHLVAFPRPRLDRDLRELLHLDPDAGDRSLTVVPEGIDLAPLDRAVREVADAARGDAVPVATGRALAELDALLATLPPERRHLPLAITVGRLHRVKGMATLVEAWASDPASVEGCNLLVVGGDLDDPTTDEAEELARICASVARVDAADRGLLLAGHRPNGVVATWLAAVRLGRPGLSAPGGVYVSASLKEEFGIAILEAMASGLVVVTPREGGPATYVEQGVTGLLVDTTSPTALAGAVVSALELAAAPDAAARADHVRNRVAEEFGVATMASSLAAIYSEVSRDAARHQP